VLVSKDYLNLLYVVHLDDEDDGGRLLNSVCERARGRNRCQTSLKPVLGYGWKPAWIKIKNRGIRKSWVPRGFVSPERIRASTKIARRMRKLK